MTTTPHTISRRDVLALALSAATVAVATPFSAQAFAASLAEDDSRQPLPELLDRFAEELLRLSPVTATELGLDSGPRTFLKSALDDASLSGERQWEVQLDTMLKRLASIDRTSLDTDEKIRYDKVRYAAMAGRQGTQFLAGRAQDGFHGGAIPYVVTQQDGAVTAIPEFLDAKHRIGNAADAEAYLARMEAMARLLDQESASITVQASKGVIPPDFILRTTLAQLQGYRLRAVHQQKLVTSLVERTKTLGIDGDWQARATQLVNLQIYPALDRQIAALTRIAPLATDVPGVDRFTDGPAYYQWALKLGTTTTASAAEVHATGIEQNREIASRMDAIFKAQGMTQGTVAERIGALSKDPSRFFSDDARGRDALIGYCNDQVAAIRKLMPAMSHLGLKAALVIKRVPADIEAGAPLGYMSPAPLDGSRPAIYYINLKSTRLWAKHELASLTAHEGVPGHAWQFAYLAERSGKKPLIDSLIGFNAFIEGWALYAEQLCDEAGLYATDPFSQLGYLSSQQFRACRLVVDTGLHAMHWTRQQAIRYMVDNTGRSTAAMTSEVDRYTVSPGQACGYKMGHNEILRLRQQARLALGKQFDVAAFNDALVKSTGAPLTLLAGVVFMFFWAARKCSWGVSTDSDDTAALCFARLETTGGRNPV